MKEKNQQRKMLLESSTFFLKLNTISIRVTDYTTIVNSQRKNYMHLAEYQLRKEYGPL